MGSAIQTAFCQIVTPQSDLKRSRTTQKKEAEMTTSTPNEPLLSSTRTPSEQITRINNPFEIGLAERLHLPSMSPSVFTTVTTQDESNKSFRWSIEQMATLHPAEIDDGLATAQENAHWSDHDFEQKAQDAINIFFSQRHIVPSPWLQCQKNVAVNNNRCLSISSSVVSSETAKNLKSVKTQNASTQTTLTLPVDFDLESILSSYFTFRVGSPLPCHTAFEENLLSVSTLRRKLFFHEDENQNCLSGSSSPTPDTKETLLLTTTSTNSMHLSSSPSTSDIKRTSTSPLAPLISPTVSPIGNNFDSIDQDRYNTDSMPSLLSPVAVLSTSDVLENYQSEDSGIPKTTCLLAQETQVTEPGTSATQDTGYSTQQFSCFQDSTQEGTSLAVNKIRSRVVTFMSPEQRMSWAPTEFSTPEDSSPHQMSLDYSIC